MARGFVGLLVWISLCIGGISNVLAADAVSPTSGTVGPANTLIVLGDSISAGYGIPAGSGWVDLLQQRLDTQGIEWKVVNASISGETTKGGLARLPALLERHQPSIVVIELGGNDGLRGYPLARIRANLETMLQLNQKAGAQTILAGMRLPPNYGDRYAKPFFEQYAKLARQYKTGLVPFFLDGVATQQGLMQEDGIHPTEIAQERLLDQVWKSLEPMLKRAIHQP
ncbi:MAG: arylesterase [Pseudomonadales bacterium]|nr:arylesterase [Pseudomonadales bacterium]